MPFQKGAPLGRALLKRQPVEAGDQRQSGGGQPGSNKKQAHQ
ncbi:MAG: hypothetical protein Q8M26_16430 [Pseudolabrys sp.]|nr:hypothetical protein [Pseudolabrys sp.]